MCRVCDYATPSYTTPLTHACSMLIHSFGSQPAFAVRFFFFIEVLLLASSGLDNKCINWAFNSKRRKNWKPKIDGERVFGAERVAGERKRGWNVACLHATHRTVMRLGGWRIVVCVSALDTLHAIRGVTPVGHGSGVVTHAVIWTWSDYVFIYDQAKRGQDATRWEWESVALECQHVWICTVYQMHLVIEHCNPANIL